MKIKLAITVAAIILGAQSISASTTGALAKATKKLIIENQNMSAQIKENTKNTLENKVSLEEIKIFYKEAQVNGESKTARENRDAAINKLTISEEEAKEKNAAQDIKLDTLKTKYLNLSLELDSVKQGKDKNEANIEKLKEDVQSMKYKIVESMKQIKKNAKKIDGTSEGVFGDLFSSKTRESSKVTNTTVTNNTVTNNVTAKDLNRIDSLEKQFKEFKLAQEKAMNEKTRVISSLYATVQDVKAENSALKDTVDRYQAQISNYQGHVTDKLNKIEAKSSVNHLRIIEKKSIVRDCDTKKVICDNGNHKKNRTITSDDAVILDFINN